MDGQWRNAKRRDGNAPSAYPEKFSVALTAKDTSRQGQQCLRMHSFVWQSRVLSAQGAHRRRNLPRIRLDQRFVLCLLQQLTTAEGSVGFPRVLERHERAQRESCENDKEHPSKFRVHGSKIVLGNLLSLGSMTEYKRRVATGKERRNV